MALTDTNSAPPFFMGEFRHALDGKSRLTVPSAWRVEEEGEFFLIPSSSGACVKVMLRAELERIRGLASALPGPQRLEVLRSLGANSRQCKLDKAGRLVVPEEFCKSQSLSGEVTMVGAMETFEIWNTQIWDAARAKTAAIATPHLAEFGL